MRTPRTLIVSVTLAAVAAAPLAVAGSASAAPAYSVSSEHCTGGIAVVGYASLAAAKKADARLVAKQKAHPHTLRTVQLRKGSKLIKASTKHC